MRFFIVVIVALCLSGCGGCRGSAVRAAERAVENHVTEMNKADAKDRTPLKIANDKVATIEGELAKAKAERDEVRYASLRRLAFSTAAIAFLATCGAIAAAFFLPVFRKQLLMGAAACVAVIVICLTFQVALNYIPWIGGAIVLVIIGYLVLALTKSRTAIRMTAAAGDEFANALTDGDIKNIKQRLSIEQMAAGVHNLIQEARGKSVKIIRSVGIHDAPR